LVAAAVVVDGDDDDDAEVDASFELAFRAATASGTAAIPTETSVMSRRRRGRLEWKGKRGEERGVLRVGGGFFEALVFEASRWFFFFSFFDRAIEIAITSPLTFFFEQLAARSLFLL